MTFLFVTFSFCSFIRLCTFSRKSTGAGVEHEFRNSVPFSSPRRTSRETGGYFLLPAPTDDGSKLVTTTFAKYTTHNTSNGCSLRRRQQTSDRPVNILGRGPLLQRSDLLLQCPDTLYYLEWLTLECPQNWLGDCGSLCCHCESIILWKSRSAHLGTL